MMGNGKYGLVIMATGPVVVPVGAPKTLVVVTIPPVFEIGAPTFKVPVQVAPVGQQATFLTASVVHMEPAVQQAPLYPFCVQPLKFTGQFEFCRIESSFFIGAEDWFEESCGVSIYGSRKGAKTEGTWRADMGRRRKVKRGVTLRILESPVSNQQTSGLENGRAHLAIYVRKSPRDGKSICDTSKKYQ